MSPTPTLHQAQQLDRDDEFAPLRAEFAIPRAANGEESIYLVGNSLGLRPRKARDYVLEELDKWAALGVRGHTESEHPWAPYHEFLAEPSARIVGALPDEVVVMNALTVNLHLMMASLYRPTPQRNKILIERGAFPSDHFAVESQLRHHGINPAEALIALAPRAGEDCLRMEDVAAAIDAEGKEIALILLPGVQYYTGQLFDMAEIVRLGHARGCIVGFDLAHAVGNVPLQLHDWGADFACWCTYKYLNSGPGAPGGCFIHARHAARRDLNRLSGWWGHNKATRFAMGTEFDPIPTAEGWQLSNAPILGMAAMRASLELFDRAGGVAALRRKSERQIRYLDALLAERLAGRVVNITPPEMAARGCQFSLRTDRGKPLFDRLIAAGVACDWRHPDIIRIAPTPLYNRFVDLWRFVALLEELTR